MAAFNLAQQRWTLLADIVPASAGPVILEGAQRPASAFSLSGSDQITATGNAQQGIGALLSNGRFFMGLGNDQFTASAAAGDAGIGGWFGTDGTEAQPDGQVGGAGFQGEEGWVGLSLIRGSRLHTGVDLGLFSWSLPDDDTVLGIGGQGGEGGRGGQGGAGAAGVLGGDGGDGGDGGVGGTGGIGIFVAQDASLCTGDGRDSITGIGGAGGRGGLGGAGGSGGSGSSANGADGQAGSAGAAGKQGFGIWNDGVIDTGRGRDVLDAIQGGFAGSGRYFMGRGADLVKGFGSGSFYGQAGFDALILPGLESDYVLTAINGSADDFVIQNTTGDIRTMTVYSFESIQFAASI